jgi:plastocyanin
VTAAGASAAPRGRTGAPGIRRGLAAGTLLVGLVLLAACSSGGDGANPPVKGVTQVAAKGLKFSPKAIEVPAGTTVTWRFDDGGVPHDVKGDGWTSGKPRATGTFSHPFAQAGTYAYKCTIHPGMTGKVVVTAG